MKRSAFSLIEVLVAVAVIGVLASVAHVAIGDLSSAAREQRMDSDVDSLNRAVEVYLANGGNLDNAQNISQVLSRLKSRVDSDHVSQSVGLTSQLVDPRTTVKTSRQSKGAKTVSWNSGAKRFEVGVSDSGSVTEFVLDDDLAEENAATDERTLAVKFASESGWIWDYEDRAPASTNLGPTPISLVTPSPTPSTPAPTSSSSSSPSPAPSPSAPSMGTLQPPKTSLPAGTYPIYNYDLSVTLTNPNPAGVSKLVYALDYGAWIDYTGTIVVPAGSNLSVQALALSTDWSDSRKDDYGYQASPATLAPPIISPSRNSFGYLFGRTIVVNLQNPNPAGSSELVYRLNGGPWQAYKNSFNLKRDDYPAGVTIEARAQSPSSPYWSPSTTSSRSLSLAALDLAGSTDGAFYDPYGDPAMVTNLAGAGSSSSYFEWGDIVRRTGDTKPLARSSMEFGGLGFSAIQEGQRFQVGTLDYFNGSAYAFDPTGTISAATKGVSFGINVDLVADGVSLATTFNFDFELVNTINAEDPLNPWPDADFVRIGSPVASETLLIDGREYVFRLEFGDATANGLAQFDEFHVLEWAGAATKVYGTFSEAVAP